MFKLERPTSSFVRRFGAVWIGVPMGGDLGGTGGRSQKCLGGGTAHASVPQYFEKQCLSDACESTNRVKKV